MPKPSPAAPVANPAIAEFFRLVKGQNTHAERRRQRDSDVEREKALLLTPVRQLLKALVDAGVVVKHRDSYNHGAVRRQPPSPLAVYEDESSTSWLPGRSIMLDHPAEIEIAVPNEHQRASQGVVVISCMTADHPQEALLRGPFFTVEAACMALSKFLAASTVKVARSLEKSGDGA